jgi:hypothetical protein
VIDLLVRWRIVVVTLVCGVVAAAFPVTMDDQGYLRDGAHALLDGTPWDVYAQVADLQFGPLSLLVGAALPGLALPAAVLGCLSLALWLIDRDLPSRLMLFAGLLVAVSWAFLVATGHLDDALAVALLATAAVVRRRPWLATLLVVLAAAAKPWAVCVAPVLATSGLLWVGVAVVGTGLVYLPFALGGGLSSAVTFHVAPDTLLGLLSVDPSPSWWRFAQLAAMAVVAALLARQGWWPVVVAVVAVRITLDPGSWPYVVGPLAVAALACDIANRRDVPATVLAATAVLLTTGTGPPWQWVIRAVLCAACIVLARPRGVDPGRRRPDVVVSPG